MNSAGEASWRAFLSRLGGTRRVTLVGPLLDGAIDPDGPTVYVDGGAEFRENMGAEQDQFPSVSVGDGDSGLGVPDLLLPEEKDYSDLAFVLRELPVSVVELRLFGFLGGLLDHQLAVLGELHRWLLARGPSARVELLRAGGKSADVTGTTGPFKFKAEGRFSVLVLQPTPIKIAGDCKFKFDGVLDFLSSHGLSNEGRRGQVTIESTTPYFVFFSS